MRIGIDIKNLAIYSGGISHFFRPLLRAWIETCKDCEFILIGPEFDNRFLNGLQNYIWHPVPFLRKAPGAFKHPIYDMVLAPAAIRKIAPDLFLSPYYDILMPKNLRTIVTVHDLCFYASAKLYPARLRWYYLGMLKRNITMADRIITVSETSKEQIIQRFNLSPAKIHVVYNSCEREFYDATCDHGVIEGIRAKHNLENCHSVFYPGGLEYRKNIDNMVDALEVVAKHSGFKIKLLISGELDKNSLRRWNSLKRELPFTVVFTGHLDLAVLKQYYFAVDTVVYLSFCEGFGRVCLESMVAGTPLVCSDLAVFREIAENYPLYCNPENPQDIAEKILLSFGQKQQAVNLPVRFDLAANVHRFLNAVKI